MGFSRTAAAAAAIALCSMTPANVSATPMDEEGLTIGVGIICNTSEQMQRLVGLRGDGAEVVGAVNVVNKEAKDPRACGVAAVAYMSEQMVEMKNVRGKLVQIVRINVVAAFDGSRWSRVPAMTQYALIESGGYAI